MISDKIKAAIRDIPDFPKPGIVFKDITPLLKNPVLCNDIVESFAASLGDIKIDAVAGIESRGFLFGLMLAIKLQVPFVPIRKPGKLPFTTYNQQYDLEYGSAVIELHTDAFEKGSRILIHDDLLATGGTVEAAGKLIEKMGGIVSAYSFIVGLGFLNGIEKIGRDVVPVIVLANYE